MKPNFKTPVSMQVTKEQYKADLEKPLLAMGYYWNDKNIDADCQYGYNFLQTNYNNGADTLGMYFEDKEDYHIIEEYNPELFLAIAGMTEGDEWIVGEWLYYYDEELFFECKFLKGCSASLGYARPGSDYYRKATLEELTKHFTKTNCLAGGEALMHEATHTVTIPNPNKFPKEMFVSDCEDFSREVVRVIDRYDPNLKFPYLTKQNRRGVIFCFKYAKDIPEPIVEEPTIKKMSVSEIQEALGFKIEIVE